MELIAPVAIGLNPYIGMFVLAALAAFTTHVPSGALLDVTPVAIVAAVAALFGMAAPIDFVLGKFIRFAPAARRASQLIAPAAGAVAAASMSSSGLPLPLVASIGAVLAWSVAAMLTGIAARASRSAAWVGLGHVPVLMAAATAAACIVPLAVARPGIGYVLSVIALSTLLTATFAAKRTPAPAATRRGRTVLPASAR